MTSEAPENMEEQRFRRSRDQMADALRQMAVTMSYPLYSEQADAMQQSQRPTTPRNVVTMNNINVTGQVGVLNTGTIYRMKDLDIKLSQVSKGGAPELSAGIARLAEAVARSGLDPTLKDEAVRNLDVLASQAASAAPERQPTLARAAISALGVVLSASADLVQLWQAFLPAILTHLGLPPS